MVDSLPSWHDKPRHRLVEFVERVTTPGVDFVPPHERIAVFDNDGTLWCEQPNYMQAEFVVDELRARSAQDVEFASRTDVQAILAGGLARLLRTQGLGAVAEVLLQTHAGVSADDFSRRVAAWFADAIHPRFGVHYAELVYAPMLELLDYLRAYEFTNFIVTGGGVEFVRAVSDSLYSISRDDVIGSAVQVAVARDADRVDVVRQPALLGSPNEGEPKIVNIAMHIGRRPVFAAGNSAGDRAMLEYCAAGERPSLCLVVDHDDATREYAYQSGAVTAPDAEPIIETAAREGWMVVSMRHDWALVFNR
jgi:phosphoglycolate phosphatase-like HAD superfamily hydrolase